jgi:hypothetical protein
LSTYRLALQYTPSVSPRNALSRHRPCSRAATGSRSTALIRTGGCHRAPDDLRRNKELRQSHDTGTPTRVRSPAPLRSHPPLPLLTRLRARWSSDPPCDTMWCFGAGTDQRASSSSRSCPTLCPRQCRNNGRAFLCRHPRSMSSLHSAPLARMSSPRATCGTSSNGTPVSLLFHRDHHLGPCRLDPVAPPSDHPPFALEMITRLTHRTATAPHSTIQLCTVLGPDVSARVAGVWAPPLNSQAGDPQSRTREGGRRKEDQVDQQNGHAYVHINLRSIALNRLGTGFLVGVCSAFGFVGDLCDLCMKLSPVPLFDRTSNLVLDLINSVYKY